MINDINDTVNGIEAKLEENLKAVSGEYALTDKWCMVLIESLINNLRQVQQRFRDDKDCAGRKSVILALHIVLTHLAELAPIYNEELNRPLSNLIAALQSLDHGYVAPLLKPAPFSKRPKGNLLRDSMKGVVVFVTNRLIKTGLPVPEAYQKVAATLNKAGVDLKYDNRPITKSTIKKWRDDSSAIYFGDRDKNSIAATIADLELQYPIEHYSPSPGQPEQTEKLREAYYKMLYDFILNTRASAA